MMKSFTQMAVAAVAALGLSAPMASGASAQQFGQQAQAAPQLPLVLQQQLTAALQLGDADVLTTVQALIGANPGFAAAIAGAVVAQRQNLAAAVTTIAVTSQPDQANAIVNQVASVVTNADSLVQVFTSAAAVVPDQSGNLLNTVNQQAQNHGVDVGQQLAAALTDVQPAGGGQNQGGSGGGGDAGGGGTGGGFSGGGTGGDTSGTQENPAQTGSTS